MTSSPFQLSLPQTSDAALYKAGHIDFKHDTKRRLSACVITMDSRVVAIGFAQCSLIDQFNRRVGRKQALADAVARLPKDRRRAIWMTYFDQFPKDKANAH